MLRRHFLKNTGLTTLGLGLVAATPIEILAQTRKNISPNSTIGVGLIGCKGMGWANLTSMLKMGEVTCLGLCDIDDTVLEQRKAELARLNQQPTLYKDYRRLLENQEIQVVIIATPDHWHCLMMADACAAGKHMLLEKPASNSIGEAETMVKIARRHQSMVQVNQWQRSQQHFKDAIDFVHSGKLGNIAQAKAWMYNGHQVLPPVQDGAVPAGVDYNMWLGPAPKRNFNANRFHYNFRWYWDYAGGLMTDWGVHLIDMVVLGMKAGLPETVMSLGGHIAYPNDARETPDTQTAVYAYKNFQLTWEHTMGRQYGLYGMGHGIAFIGNNGTLLLNRDGWEVKPEKEKGGPKMEAVEYKKRVDNGLDLHTANLIGAIKAANANLLNCPIEAAANTAIHCHLGNVAYRSGAILHIKHTDKGVGLMEREGNKLATPVYHNGWKLPV